MPGVVGEPVKVPSGLSTTPGGSCSAGAVKTRSPPSGSVAVTGAGVEPTGTVWPVLPGVASKAGAWLAGLGTVITRVVVSVRPPGSVTVTVTV